MCESLDYLKDFEFTCWVLKKNVDYFDWKFVIKCQEPLLMLGSVWHP